MHLYVIIINVKLLNIINTTETTINISQTTRAHIKCDSKPKCHFLSLNKAEHLIYTNNLKATRITIK